MLGLLWYPFSIRPHFFLGVIYALLTVVTGLSFTVPNTATVGQTFSVEWSAVNGDPNTIPLYLQDDTAQTTKQFQVLQTKGPGSSGTISVPVIGSSGNYRIVAYFPPKLPMQQNGPDASSGTISVIAQDSQTSQQPPASSQSSIQAPSSTITSSSTQNPSPSPSSSSTSSSLGSQSNSSSSSSPISSPSQNATTATINPSTTGTTDNRAASSLSSSSKPSSTKPADDGNDNSGTTIGNQTGSSNPTDTSPSLSPSTSSSNSGAVSANKAAIIGGVIGALLGLFIFIGIIVFIRHVRRRRKRATIAFYRDRMVRNDIPSRPSTESINYESPERLATGLL